MSRWRTIAAWRNIYAVGDDGRIHAIGQAPVYWSRAYWRDVGNPLPWWARYVVLVTYAPEGETPPLFPRSPSARVPFVFSGRAERCRRRVNRHGWPLLGRDAAAITHQVIR